MNSLLSAPAVPQPPDLRCETCEAAIEHWVVAQLADLRAEAEAVVIDFDQAMRDALQDADRRTRGLITLRLRVPRSPPATPGAFTVDWYRFNYARQGGQVRCYTTYLPRGDGDRYPAGAFRGLLRAWQRPIVTAAEERCALIRRAVRQIAQVRTQYRQAVRTEREVREALAAFAATTTGT